MSANGEFVFSLEERIDRYGKLYLFGSIRMLNSVLFVRKDDDEPEAGQPSRWRAVLKPYVKKEDNGTRENSDSVWEDDTNHTTNVNERKHEGKRK